MDEPIREALPEEEPPRKHKVICRVQDGRYTEQYVSEDADPAARQAAGRLLHAFAPEATIRQLTKTCGQDAVLVFRTDSRQLAEFTTLLQEHDTAVTGG